MRTERNRFRAYLAALADVSPTPAVPSAVSDSLRRRAAELRELANPATPWLSQLVLQTAAELENRAAALEDSE